MTRNKGTGMFRWGFFAVGALVTLVAPAHAQPLTGTLMGTVSDAQGAVVQGATVRLRSQALIGGPATLTTNDKGQLRFPLLPPGVYALDIEREGFARYHAENILIGVNATVVTTAVLRLAGVVEAVVVEGARPHTETRDAGFTTRYRSEELRGIPTRRSSMFDFVRATPGISPTSPSSGTANTVSAFGSGTNENLFLIDGTSFTCPCNGASRAEPVVDFIEEIQVQSIGASAEFGNMQGAVINAVTRQGGDRLAFDAAYYGQSGWLTSQPVRLRVPGGGELESGYERARYREFTTTAGGPVVRDRLWFFTGYQYLRDYDSQPGSDPRLPRTYEQDKAIAKLTWRLPARFRLMQSAYKESWVSPEQPTLAKPFEATYRRTASSPAVTFGDLTQAVSANTVWDVRIARFAYRHQDGPSSGSRTTPGRIDSATGLSSGAPPVFGGPTIARTTIKATVSHYRSLWWAADHEWKAGGQVETAKHDSTVLIPTGQRFVDVNGRPSEVISSPASNLGGWFTTASAFATDAVTLGNRLTLNAGVRFDHSRAVSPDLRRIDQQGQFTDEIVRGVGRLYTWNLWSPRLGLSVSLGADRRTTLRASYGRFNQGLFTGEFQSFHPGATAITTTAFDPAVGTYSGASRVVDPRVNLLLDRETRAPRTDEFSVGADRQLGRQVTLSIAYVRKDGANFIGWTDSGGQYRADARTLPDGRSVPVFALENRLSDRRFLLTNPEGYSLTYSGLVTVIEKRRSKVWQASASYVWSRAYGLQPSSGTNAAGAQASTVAPPPAPAGVTFGRDPNDLTNARGRLPNDRPHVFRLRGSVELPGSGVVLAGHFQQFSGKPWAATAQLPVPQNPQQRVLLEPRGSRRLSSQSLLDLRISKAIVRGRVGRVELLLDLLNALNESAEESIVTDDLFSANFGRPNVFVDPRRALFSVRGSFGR
jgi:hypothetical protein